MPRKSVLRCLPPVFGIVLLLLFPAQAAAGVSAGLRLAVETLLPSLFPISVLSGCLVRLASVGCGEGPGSRLLHRLFGVSGPAALPLALGLLGGFPLGAQLVGTACREGRLSRTDAIRLSPLCNNAGPAFLIGVAGGVLGSPRLGAALVGIQLLSIFLTGLLLRQAGSSDPAPKPSAAGREPRLREVLPRSIGDSAFAMLRLTGTVCFFSAGLACLEVCFLPSGLSSVWTAALSGLLEISAGIVRLRGTALDVGFPLAALLVNWGGCCVHMQAADALGAAGLPMRPYLLGKLLQAGIGVLLAVLLTAVFHRSLSTASVFAGGFLLILTFFAILKKTIGFRQLL